MNNIILIGMPGCGKSTIGRMLAKKLKLSFCDLDNLLEEDYSIKISDIFKNHGEPYFRELETNIAKKASNFKNHVIATGGGVVTSKENIDYLSKSGTIVFIDRSLEDILSDVATEDRPLLKDDKNRLIDLYNKRYPLYNKFSDVRIENRGSLEEVIIQIIKIISI